MAYTWSLSNASVYGGAPDLGYPVGPDQLLYVAANRTLWVSFATPSAGGGENLSLWNATDGLSTVVTGIGNVTAWTLSAASETVFLTQVPPGSSTGQLVALSTRDPDLLRPPLPLEGTPTAIALDPATSDLWIAESSNASGPGRLAIVSAESGAYVANRSTGSDPSAVTFDAPDGLGFVANAASDNISIWNDATGAVVRQVALPGPVVGGAMAFDGATGRLLALVNVGSVPSSQLVVIDPGTGAFENRTTVPPPGAGTSLAVDDRTGNALVATTSAGGPAGALEEWNSTTGAWRTLANVGGQPSVQAFDPSTGIDFVGHTGQVFVTTVNVTPDPVVLSTIDLGAGPSAAAYDPTNGRTYVVDSFRGGPVDGSGPDEVFAVDTANATSATPIPLAADGAPVFGAELAGIAYAPASGRLFVPSTAWSSAFVVAPAGPTVVANLSLPFPPVSVAVDPARSVVYFASADGRVAGYGTSNLSEVSQWNVTAPSAAPVAGLRQNLAVVPSTGQVVLVLPNDTAGGASVAWVVDPSNGTRSSLAFGTVSDSPSSVVVDPTDGAAYVGMDLGEVYALNLTGPAVVGQVSLAGASPAPVRLAWDPGRTAVLAAAEGTDRLTELNGTSAAGISTPLASLTIGPGPDGVSLVAATDQVVVSEYGGGTVQMVSDTPVAADLTVHQAIPTVGQGVPEISRDDVGWPVDFDILAGGGQPPLSVAFRNLPPGCATSNTTVLLCYPTGTGAFAVAATVTDATGAVARVAGNLTVVPDPSVTLVASPSPLDASSATVNLTATIAGGVGPFRIAVDPGVPGDAIVHATTPGPTFSTRPTYPADGSYVATIVITDSLGTRNTSTASVVLRPVMTGSLAVNPGSRAPVAGAEVPFSVRVVGGFGPYDYSWTCGGVASDDAYVGASNSTTGTCVFPSAGEETIVAWVNDSAHGSLRLTLNVRVAAPPRAAGPDLVLLAAIGLGAAAALGLAAYGVVRYRRRPPPN